MQTGGILYFRLHRHATTFRFIMRIQFLILICLFVGPQILAAQTPDTVRLVHYNVMRYGDPNCLSFTVKNNRLRTIFTHLRPDLLSVNELFPGQVNTNSFQVNTLMFNPLMQAAPVSNTTGSEIVNGFFYNSAKFGLLEHEAITGSVRDIDVYRLYHKASTKPGDTSDFHVIVAHFKSSTGQANETARALAAQRVTNWLLAHPQAQRVLFCGDLNLYGSTEPAWQTLTTYFDDPVNAYVGWVGPAFAAVHTQSPDDGSIGCAVGGGLDNRFDFILATPEISGGADRLYYLPEQYQTVGNNGNSYNTALNCNNNNSVPLNVCTALVGVSDHLPQLLPLVFKPAEQSSVGGAEARPALRVLGNPVRGHQLLLELQNAPEQPLAWQLFDALGRVIVQGKTTPVAGRMLLPLGAAKGLCYLSLRGVGGVKVLVE